MTSKSSDITSMASTSKATGDAFTNIEEGKSTGKDADKQTVPNARKKRGIGLVTQWLRMVEPRNVPYFPQLKDNIVYLRQAHENYLKEVEDRKIYTVTESDKLWIEMGIDDYMENLTVTRISFEKYPSRVACLEVRKINEKDQAIGPVYKLKYHDMGDVIDFLILKHVFKEGLQRKWNVGDQFRCLVGDNWFFGIIKSKQPYEKKFPKSSFKCFQIKWDDEKELDYLSPWELEVINKSRLPKNHGEYVEKLNIEIIKMRYDPGPDDWLPWKDRKAASKKIISELTLLMDLPISKCIIEIKKNSIYDALVKYPIDLSTIKERVEKYFYRRIDSLEMEIKYLQENAEQHKPEKLQEVQLIAKICEDILKDNDSTSSFENLKKFLENDMNSSDPDNDDDNIFNPGKRKRRQGNSKNWRTDGRRVLNILWQSEDMFPFRQNVCRDDYPDYYEIITSPICLEDIKRKFDLKEYDTPKPMFDDIKLLISNSRKYNQDKEKAIYHATTSISNLFEALKKQINWKKESPRKKLKRKNESSTVSLPKSYQERIISQIKKEKDCKSTKIDSQKKGSLKQKISGKDDDDTIANEKRIDLKNNNYSNGPAEKLPAKAIDTSIAVETSTSRPIIQNKEKENLIIPKTNIQEKDNLPHDKKLVESINEEKSNESHNNNLDTSSVKIDTKNLPQETPKPNEDARIEVDKCNNTENNSDNSDADSVIVIDSESDDAEENQNVSGSFEAVDDRTQSGMHSTENRDIDITKTSQEKSNFKKSHKSIKARKRMLYQYKSIFKTRPCKSCDICQSIKRTYLSHVQTHHT